MSLDGALPSLEHLGVVSFLDVDATLVLKLCKLRGAFVIHFVLKVSAHGAVSLTNLAQDVSLVGLFVDGILQFLLLVGKVLTFNLGIDVLLFVIFEPVSLLLLLFFKFNISFAVMVNVFEKVNASLVLTAPLLLTLVPLLLVFVSDELVDHFFISILISLLRLVVFLKFSDFVAAGEAFIGFELLKFLFVGKGLSEKSLVALSFSFFCLFTEGFLGVVVLDEFEVTFFVKQKTLPFGFALLFGLSLPLVVKHLLFLTSSVSFTSSLIVTLLLLPVEHTHSVTNELLLFFGFFNFTLELFLSIKFPKLSVNLLFHHLRFNFTSLINQLLLSFDLGTICVETGVFLSELIVCGLESLVETAFNFFLSLLFTFTLKELETFKHLLTDLLRSLKVVMEFFFVHTVLSLE